MSKKAAKKADAAGLAMEWSDKLVSGTWLKKTRRSKQKAAKVTRKQTDNRCAPVPRAARYVSALRPIRQGTADRGTIARSRPAPD